MVKLGQYVRLRTDDEWNGLYGIICGITEDIIAVFCVAMPMYLYYARRCDEDSILEPVDFGKSGADD
jgi:hypothetical protein